MKFRILHIVNTVFSLSNRVDRSRHKISIRKENISSDRVTYPPRIEYQHGSGVEEKIPRGILAISSRPPHTASPSPFVAMHLSSIHLPKAKMAWNRNPTSRLTLREEARGGLGDTWEITVTSSIYSFAAIAHEFLPSFFVFVPFR